MHTDKHARSYLMVGTASAPPFPSSSASSSTRSSSARSLRSTLCQCASVSVKEGGREGGRDERKGGRKRMSRGPGLKAITHYAGSEGSGNKAP
jgi:hypothetical protein